MKVVQIAATSHKTIRGGSLTPMEIAQTAKRLGHTAAVLADRDMTSAWPAFIKACRGVDIAPVLGLWSRVLGDTALPGDWLWIAGSDEGARRIMLASGRLDLQESRRSFAIRKDLDGAPVITIGASNEAWLSARDGELDAVAATGPEDTNALQAAYDLKVPAIAVVPWCMVEHEPEAVALVRAYAKGITWEAAKSGPAGPMWAMTGGELKERFSAMPELMTNAVQLCEEAWGGVDRIDQTQDQSADEVQELGRQAREGLIVRVGDEPAPEYSDRLEHELSVIVELGFAPVFLLVGEWVRSLEKEKIVVGPGRGSACASLVSWSLGITQEDPIKEKLLFTRFLNPARVSPPDFDVDVMRRNHRLAQDMLIKLWEGKQGGDGIYAVKISSWQGVRRKEAFRIACRSRGLPRGVIDEAARCLPEDEEEETDPDFSTVQRSDRRIVEWAYEKVPYLTGSMKALSRHPGGIAIGTRDFAQSWPRVWTGRDVDPSDHGILQTDMNETEDMGAIKVDVLSSEAMVLIEGLIEQTKVDKPWGLEQDPKVYAKVRHGHTAGIYQLEGIGIRRAAMDLEIGSFDELRALIAIYRPGPVRQLESYAKRARGEEECIAPEPELTPVLNETYGIIIYQEQVMQTAQVLAGFSETEADEMRRAVGKKKADEMAGLKERFVVGGEGLGHTRQAMEKVWRLLETYAEYGFNRAHATAYARVGYATAWYAYHFPHEFYAGCCNMALVRDETERYLKSYLRTAAAHGIRIERPCVVKGTARFEPIVDEDGAMIVAPLETIPEIGESAANTLRKLRWGKQMKTAAKRLAENVSDNQARRLITHGVFRRLSGGETVEKAIRVYERVRFPETGAEGEDEVWNEDQAREDKESDAGEAQPSSTDELVQTMMWGEVQELPIGVRTKRVQGRMQTIAEWREQGHDRAGLAVVVADRWRVKESERLWLVDESGGAEVFTQGEVDLLPEGGQRILAMVEKKKRNIVLLAWQPLDTAKLNHALRIELVKYPIGTMRKLEALLDVYRPGRGNVAVVRNGETMYLDSPAALRPGIENAVKAVWPEATVERYEGADQ